MTDEEKLKVPERGAWDVAHAAAKVALSVVPGFGGPAVELFQLVVTPPLERRRNEWMREVGEALHELREKHGITVEDLQKNDAFLDTVYHASIMALRTSQAEKREALKNAAINAALPSAPEQSVQQMFLGFIDIFTVYHIKLLKFFDNPQAWMAKSNISFSGSALAHLVERVFPELANRRDFYDWVWQDLYLRGLVNTSELHAMMSSHGLMARRTSDFGSKFLAFIEEPASP